MYHACFVMFVSCMVFSCVVRLFRLMDFRTRYIHMYHACFVMFVSCMVFSCVVRLFRLMDFRTR